MQGSIALAPLVALNNTPTPLTPAPLTPAPLTPAPLTLARSRARAHARKRAQAPGYAPVVDACGQAGGKYPQTPVGGDSAYTATKFASMGSLGSKVRALSIACWVVARCCGVTHRRSFLAQNEVADRRCAR
jgi:hypothetical protein